LPRKCFSSLHRGARFPYPTPQRRSPAASFSGEKRAATITMTPPHLRLLLGLTTLALASACGSDSAPPAPAVDVEVGTAESMDVPVTMEWIGTTEGAVDAEIRAQVSGYLISRNYGEGTLVKEGALLFQIDPRPFQAALEQARGDLGRAQALLEKTRLDVERYTPLEKEGAVSRQELDNAVQANLGAMASVQTARAAAEKARLDLSFTEIRSPIEGIAGVELLRRTVGIVAEEGARPWSCDLTVICERPAIAPARDAMRETLAVALGIDRSRVSVKATRPEGLGLQGDGVGCLAVVVVV